MKVLVKNITNKGFNTAKHSFKKDETKECYFPDEVIAGQPLGDYKVWEQFLRLQDKGLLQITQVPSVGVLDAPTLNGLTVAQIIAASSVSTLESVGWEKAQATTASYAIVKPTSGVGLDLHIEAGGSLAALNSTSWPVPASGVDQLRIRNFSGSTKTLTAGTGWIIVTADGNPVTSGSYSIPDDRAVEITLDPDGFAQVVPWGGEVSEAAFNTHTDNISNPHGVTAAQVGLGNASNTSDANKPVSTAQQTALNLKQDASTAATDAELTAHTNNTSNPHTVTATQVGLGNVSNTSDVDKPISTAQQTALDLKSPLVSPVLTGTPQIGGNPKLGSNAGHAQRSYSDITGAAMLMVPATGTATSTIATSDVAARYVKPGTAGTKANAAFDIVVGSHTAGINGSTQVDFRLANAGTNAPDTTVLSLKSDGAVLANGLQVTSLATTGTPVMNGTAALGTATTAAHSDHVHGSDTSRFPQITSGTIDANSTALVDNTVYHGNNTGVITNGPTGGWAWTLINLKHGSWRTQVVYTSGNIYSRQQETTFTGATWNQFASTAFSGARVTRTTDQAITTTTGTAIEWNSEVYDTTTYHDNTTNTARLTALAAGYYRIGCKVQWATNATGERSIGWRISAGNTDWTVDHAADATADTAQSFSTDVYMTAGQYVEFMSYHTSGANLNILGNKSYATMSYLGS